MPEPYGIEFLPSAVRELAKLPRGVRGTVLEAIQALTIDPRPNGSKLLSGTGPGRIWRIAVGSYRVLYLVADVQVTVVVVRVADRRDVYNRAAMKRLLGRLPDPP